MKVRILPVYFFSQSDCSRKHVRLGEVSGKNAYLHSCLLTMIISLRRPVTTRVYRRIMPQSSGNYTGKISCDPPYAPLKNAGTRYNHRF